MKIRLFALGLLAALQLAAQTLPEDLLKNLKFRSIGPAGMSGRVTAIDVDPRDERVIYAGSASGGLWKSQNAGQSWTSIWDEQPNPSIGALRVDPSNPDVVWVGTGEGNPRNSQTIGGGIFRSLDAGKTWQPMGLAGTKGIHRIVVHPRDPNTILVAAIGLAYGDTEDRGVYKTTDGGKTWRKVLYRNNRSGAADLVMDPVNPNKLFAAMWEYRRWPWFFKSGGDGSGLFVSHDAGETWTQRTSKDGLPEGQLGRIGLAIAPSHPNVVYALVENKEKNALYRSDDGGVKWARISDADDIGNRPFYYSEIYVDPFRENTVYSLWTLVTKSDDGGRSWKTVAPYSDIHPDHHALWLSSKTPDYLIEGNDGGLNISHDGGESWRFAENLPLAQFYHISVDNQLPYNVYGGMQDNGSWKGPAYHTKGSIGNSDWTELYFGDGFDVLPHPTDESTVYAMAQEGSLGRVSVLSGLKVYIKPTQPQGAPPLRFHWNSPIAGDPFNDDGLYYGSQHVHYSADRGATWTTISGDLTTNNPEKQKYLESGGLTFDVTGAEMHTCLLTIAPSRVQKGIIWTGSDDGTVQLTRDGGTSWTRCTIKGFPEGAWVPQVQASTFNAAEAWVVVNNYRQNDFTPYLFYTKDFGKTWSNLLAAGRPDGMGHCLSVKQDPAQASLVYLGTETGLFVSSNAGKTWQRWAGLPVMPVQDIAIQEREGDLVLGTFGRAAWVLDDLRPIREAAAAKGRVLTAYDAPDAYHWIYAESDGIRFQGNAMFQGENRSGGARMSYTLQRDTADKELKKVKWLRVDIYDPSGSRIRRIETKVPSENGLQRWNWNLRSAGIQRPSMSREKRENASDPGSGPEVKPGRYLLVYEFGPHRDSSYVTVYDDPRAKRSDADWIAQHAFAAEVSGVMGQLDSAVTKLREAKKRLNLMEKLVAASDDTASSKAVRDDIKAALKSIEDRRMALYGKEDVKGYFEQPETWEWKYGQFSSYYWGLRGAPSANVLNAWKAARSASEAEVAAITKWEAEVWLPFRAKHSSVAMP